MHLREINHHLRTALEVYLSAGSKEQRQAASVVAKTALSHKETGDSNAQIESDTSRGVDVLKMDTSTSDCPR